jgi:preprotein translocase subunit SecB
MKTDQRELLQQAISALQLRDIMLNECSFKRPNPPPPASDSIKARQLTKQTVTFVVGEVEQAERRIKLLQVIVALGIRIAALHAKNRPIYFEIEADFLVEYEVKAKLSEAAIKAFADANSVHNVWPFWRQHVFDIVSRARLPHLQVPLFNSGIARELPRLPKTKRPARQGSGVVTA